MRALGTVHAKVRRKKSKFPIIRLVRRLALGVLMFFQRISAGRGARASVAPSTDFPFWALAMMWAEGMVE